MNFPFFIAKRYLISKKSHNAINIISIISVVGICIATAALVIVLSAFNGISELVTSLYNSFDPEIEITVASGKTFNPDSEEMINVKKMPEVAHFVEVVEGNALLKYEDQQSVATIKGVDSSFNRMNRFDSLMVDGRFDISKNNIVLGGGLDYILNLNTGGVYSMLSVYAPQRGAVSKFAVDGGLNEIKTRSVGTFSISDEFDNTYAFMHIDDARILFDYTNEVTSIELGLSNISSVELIQERIKQLLGEKYIVKNREEQNELWHKTKNLEKLWVYIILMFILMIATFNVVGSLTMLIIEKKKDIAVLLYMGASLNQIRRIFMIEGLMVTLLGGFVGLILGYVVCWVQQHYALLTIDDGYVIDAYPIKMEVLDFIGITATVLLIGVFAAWYTVRVFTKKYA